MSRPRSKKWSLLILAGGFAALCVYCISGTLRIHYHLAGLRTNLHFANVVSSTRADTFHYRAARILGFVSGKRSNNDWAPAWLDHFHELTRLRYFTQCEIPFTNKSLTCRAVYVATWQTMPVGTALWDVCSTQSVVVVTARPRDLPKWRALLSDLDKKL